MVEVVFWSNVLNEPLRPSNRQASSEHICTGPSNFDATRLLLLPTLPCSLKKWNQCNRKRQKSWFEPSFTFIHSTARIPASWWRWSSAGVTCSTHLSAQVIPKLPVGKDRRGHLYRDHRHVMQHNCQDFLAMRTQSLLSPPLFSRTCI